jgi:tetratricopeptide (TPR) repeat protein
VDRSLCSAVAAGRARRGSGAAIEDAGQWRLAGLIALPLLLAAAPAPADDEPFPPELRPKAIQLQRAAEAFDRGDCKAALSLARPLIAQRAGPHLPDAAEAIAYDLVVGCEADGDRRRAYADALAGTRLEHSSDALWHERLLLEMQAERYDAAVATLEAMTQGRGAALSAVPDDWLPFLNRRLADDSKAPLRRRFLKAVTDDSYAPAAGSDEKDRYRHPYALLLAEAGEQDAARAQVAALRSPYWLRQASVDPRLRAFLPADLDLRAATEAMLAADRDMMARRPDRLNPVLNAAGDLRELGRPEESLQLLQSVAAKVEDPAAYADRKDKLTWWWDGLARSYTRLGKYDEAVAAYRKGAALPEGDQPNVSQVINLAEMQIDYGRAEDALKTIAVFDDPKRKGSPYGEMQVRFARGCANFLASHKAEAQADLAYARSREKDDPETVSSLLLCMDDMDGAAASFVRRLDDPKQRVRALLQLSDYADPPVPQPLGPVEGRLAALKQRPDVKAAIARAGGTRRFNVRPSDV